LCPYTTLFRSPVAGWPAYPDQAPLRPLRMDTKRRILLVILVPWPPAVACGTIPSLILRQIRGSGPGRGGQLPVLEVHGAADHGPDRGRDVVQHQRRDGRVDGEHDQRVTAPGVPSYLHAGYVDALTAQDLADRPHHAGPVCVGEEHHVLGW